MSSKAARGTKRLCGGCGARFYDLNKSPIICPLCEAEFKIIKPSDDEEDKAKQAESSTAQESTAKKSDDLIMENDLDPDLAAVDDEDLADIDDGDDASDDDSTDAFLPDEDEGGDDVSDIIGDNKPKVGDDG